MEDRDTSPPFTEACFFISFKPMLTLASARMLMRPQKMVKIEIKAFDLSYLIVKFFKF
jgi:hypothetical protein